MIKNENILVNLGFTKEGEKKYKFEKNIIRFYDDYLVVCRKEDNYLPYCYRDFSQAVNTAVYKKQELHFLDYYLVIIRQYDDDKKKIIYKIKKVTNKNIFSIDPELEQMCKELFSGDGSSIIGNLINDKIIDLE